MQAAAYLASVEEALVEFAPGARAEVRAVRQAGTIGIIGYVSRAASGF